MAQSFAWGLLASSSLLVGGALVMSVPIGPKVLGLIMAFGAGVLISAVSFELVQEAFDTSPWSGGVAVGLLAGSLSFFAGDWLIDRAGGEDRKRSRTTHAAGTGLPIVLGIVLDGIPESFVLGLTVLQAGTVSVAFLVAVFISNVPEAVAATSGLLQSGWTRARVLVLWSRVAVVSALSALAGYALLDGASPTAIAFVLSFAGGAILTMLADTMMPEAFENEGKLVGIVTTLGFALAFAVSSLE